MPAIAGALNLTNPGRKAGVRRVSTPVVGLPDGRRGDE
jgi:hypothetical protein